MASRVVRNVVLRVVWLCLSPYPFHYHVYGVALLFFGKFASAWYAVPFLEEPRQQHAVACCAMKTGWPRMGVCRPSFGGQAGASRLRMKSAAWRCMVVHPFSFMYRMSPAFRRKRLLKVEHASLSNRGSSSWLGSAVFVSLPHGESMAKSSPSVGLECVVFLDMAEV